MFFRDLLLIVLALATAHGAPSIKDSSQRTILASVSDSILVLKSTGFPHGCCTSSSYNILGDGNNSCVKLSFDDLDLPPQVSLKLYNHDVSGSITLIYQHQDSNTSAQSVICPSVLTSSFNGSLRLILDGTNTIYSRYYAGFKLRYWSAKDNCLVLNASDHNIHHSNPGSCRIISTVSGGELLRAYNAHLHSNIDIIEFIWVVKLPDYIPPRDTDALVFGQILVKNIDGEFDIRRDTHSDAELMQTDLVTTNNSSLSTMHRMYFTSSSGFYIRAVIKWKGLMENTSNLSILTGVYRQHVTDFTGWFLCQSSSWYIPQQHVCDSIEHCPLGEDEHVDICHSQNTDNKSDMDFLKWLIPVVGSFILLAITVCFIKISTQCKNHQRNNNSGGPGDTVNNLQSTHDIAASQRLLAPVGRASAFGVPVPAARVPSSSVCIPIAGSLGTSGSVGAAGRSEMAGSQILRASIPNGRLGGDSADIHRTMPISIPTVRSGSSAPIVIRPLIHRENSMVPPSYEEVTAEHSCGDSTDSIEEAPDRILEYHPPSYEDASQGKTDLVSSWVASRQQVAS